MSRNLQTFTKALYGFDAVVQRVGEGQWDLPSPCEGWTARDVVGHNIVIGAQLIAILRDEEPGEEMTTTEAAGPDPADAWRISLRTLLGLLDEKGALQREGKTLFGYMSIESCIGFLTVDPFTHSWDLAVATGQAPVLDPRLLSRCTKQLEMAGDSIRRDGMFGPVSAAHDERSEDDLSPIDRFVRLAGRDPLFASQSEAVSPDDEALATKARKWLEEDAHAQALGIELSSVSDKDLVLQLKVLPEHCNSLGSLHGGVSFSLADIGMATICNLPGPTAVAIDVHMVYTAGASVGEIVTARCTAIRRGKSLASYRAELFVEERQIGSFTGTVMVKAPA